jgi:hypothetical protein
MKFTAANGHAYLARIVFKGDRYGLDGCLTHDKDDPLVEFYLQISKVWGRSLKWEGLDEPWWFINRYYVSTFLGLCEYSHSGGPVARGVFLVGDCPQYSLSAADCLKVGKWIYAQLLEKINAA